MSKDKDYTDVILEEMNGRFDLLLEAMSGLSTELKTKSSQNSVNEVKADVKVINTAVTAVIY